MEQEIRFFFSLYFFNKDILYIHVYEGHLKGKVSLLLRAFLIKVLVMIWSDGEKNRLLFKIAYATVKGIATEKCNMARIMLCRLLSILKLGC